MANVSSGVGPRLSWTHQCDASKLFGASSVVASESPRLGLFISEAGEPRSNQASNQEEEMGKEGLVQVELDPSELVLDLSTRVSGLSLSVNTENNPITASKSKSMAKCGQWPRRKPGRPSAQDQAGSNARPKFVVLRLQCPVEQCTVQVTDHESLVCHLWDTHHTHWYRCLVRGCAQSFAER